MSRQGTPQGGNNLILRRQLQELSRNPVEGFSAGTQYSIIPFRRHIFTTTSALAGLVDDNNLLEWEVMIIGWVL